MLFNVLLCFLLYSSARNTNSETATYTWKRNQLHQNVMATSSVPALTVLLIVLTCIPCGHSSKVQTSEPTNGTLEYLLCNRTLTQATNITLEPNVTYTISHNRFCVVEDIASLVLRGRSSQDLSIIQCIPENTSISVSSGFGFVNISQSIIIENVHIKNCGGVISPASVRGVNGSYFYFGRGQTTVILFNHCFGLQMRNVIITNYTGYAVIGVNVFSRDQDALQIKNVTIANSTHFDDPIPQPSYSYVGSGMLFYFVDTVRVFHTQQYPNSTTIEIAECSFSRNWNHVRDALVPTVVSTVTDPKVKNLTLDGGGAVSIVYTQSTTTVTVSIVDSQFVLSGGFLYGAVLVLFLNVPSTGFVTFDNCTFQGGFSSARKYAGSDVAVYFNFTLPVDFSNTRYHCLQIDRTNFRVGKESLPGLHARVALIQLSRTSVSCNVTLNETRFIGSSPLSFVTYGCLFAFDLGATNNLNIELLDVSSNVSNGAFKFVNLGKVRIVGTMEESSVFEGATASLIDAYASDLYLSGNVTFRNNRAQYGSGGGALLLQADSHLYLEEPLQLLFENNRATYGGAIYAVESNAPFCTFQYITSPVTCNNGNCSGDLDIHVTFANNSAELAGNSIYVDPLYKCDLILTSTITIDSQSLPTLYSSIFSFVNRSGNHLPEMSSTANDVCFCDPSDATIGRGNCNSSSNFTPSETIFPGKNFSVWMSPLDSNGAPVYSIVSSVVSSSVHHCGSPGLSPSQEWYLGSNEAVVQLLGTGCKEVSYSIHSRNQDLVPKNICISVRPVRLQTIVPNVVKSQYFYALMKPCPLGFVNNDQGTCECNKLLSKYDVECFTGSGLANVPVGSWVGPIGDRQDKIALSKFCPNGYCNTKSEGVNISNTSAICAHRRTGILCGKCPDGLSVVFGSIKCHSCSNLWFLTIAVYALAGIALVVVLLLLRMTVADGIVNGLVFYANVLSTNILVFLDHKSLHWLLNVFSLINLDLGFPICFYHGMSDVTKSYLQFAFPVYLWSIIGLVILLSRYSLTVSRFTSSYSVPVLATLIFLSYSKLLRAAMDGLVSADVEIDGVNGTTSKMTVWYFDGNIEYCTGSHIGLFVLGFVTLVFFVIPYTVGLMGAPFLIRFKIINYFKPLIDAYAGPYKDRQRFWFGTRLSVLVLIFATYAILKGRNVALLLFIEAMILAAYILVQASFNPYKSKVVYGVDTFFLVNCFLLTAYGTYLHDPDKPEALYIGAGLLVGLAFVATCLIVAFYVWLRLPFRRTWIRRRQSRASFLTQETSTGDYEPISGSTIFYSSDKFREPLLEDS